MPNYRLQFEREWRVEYDRRRRKLNPLFRLYLNIRRNYVHDIFFIHSEEHLKDMVQQFKEGRTNIITQIELGLMLETKKDWLDDKQAEYRLMMDAGDITDAQFREYQAFR